MLFSPAFQSLLPVENLPIKLHYGGTDKPFTPYFHYKGSIAAFMEALRLEYAQNTHLQELMARHNGSRWAGFEAREQIVDMLQSAHCETAYKAFEEAKSKVNTRYAKGKPELSPVGSGFSIGRIIVGHPVAAYRRPKTKLPPKVFEAAISVSGCVEHKDVTASMAKLVNACAHYHQSGGPVRFTVHYLLHFHKVNPETRAEGIAFSLDIPLNSGSLAAFAGSVQFFRGFTIPLAQSLSGQKHDSLQCAQWNTKGIVGIHGMATDGAAMLEALKIAQA